MFVFSVDHHYLTIISTDFVSIKPYNTTSVRIGIGQRYNAILIADPVRPTLARSFWMRVYRPMCFNSNRPPEVVPTEGYERAGVVFYDDETKKPDEKAVGWPVDVKSCSDEPYELLEPVVRWDVANKSIKTEDQLDVNLDFDDRPSPFPLVSKMKDGYRQ